jgi:hypothetical protein
MQKIICVASLITLFSVACKEKNIQDSATPIASIQQDSTKANVASPKDWENFIGGFKNTTLPYEVSYSSLQKEDEETVPLNKKYRPINRRLAGYFLSNIEDLQEAIKAYRDSTINADFPDGDLHTFYYLHSIPNKSGYHVVTILHDYVGLPMCGSGNFRNIRLLTYDQTGKLIGQQVLGEYGVWTDAPFSAVDMRNGVITEKLEISSECTTISSEMLDEGEKNDTTVIRTQYKLLDNGTLKVVSEEKTSTIREVEGC